MAGQSIGGARALVYANGDLVGYARDIRGNVQLTQVPAETLGHADPREHVANGRNTSLSVGLIRIKLKSAMERGLMPESGGSSQESTIRLLNFPELEFHIVDITDDTVLQKIRRCSPTGYDWSVDRGGLWQENCSYNAIGGVYHEQAA